MTVQEVRVVCGRGRVITVAIEAFAFFDYLIVAQTGFLRTAMA